MEDCGGVVLYQPAMEPQTVERWHVTGGVDEGRALVLEQATREGGSHGAL